MYQHKTLQGQNLKTKSLVTLGNKSRVWRWRQFCKLPCTLNIFLTIIIPSLSLSAEMSKQHLEVWDLSGEIHLSFSRVAWSVMCRAMVWSQSRRIPALHGSSAVSSYETFEASWFVNQQLSTSWRRRWWSRVCNEWADPELTAPLAAKYANIKWSVADLWCCYNLRGPGLHSIIEKIWIRNRNNKSQGKWLDSSWRDVQHCESINQLQLINLPYCSRDSHSRRSH